MTFTAFGEITKKPNVQPVGGQQRGGTAVSSSPRSTSEIAVWLGAQTPSDMDKAAESRALSHGVTLAVKYETRFPSGPNGERLPAYDVAVGCESHGTTAQRKAALDDLRNFDTPAPIRQIEQWLAELSVLTAGRGQDGFSAELLVTAYSSRLSQYPADVVRYALLKRSWKWFPSWQELEKVCEAKSGPRRHMIAALMQPPPDPEPKRRPPTQEERDRIAALVAEQFPSVPQEWRDAAVAEVTKGNCISDTETPKGDAS